VFTVIAAFGLWYTELGAGQAAAPEGTRRRHGGV